MYVGAIVVGLQCGIRPVYVIPAIWIAVVVVVAVAPAFTTHIVLSMFAVVASNVCAVFGGPT